MSYSLVKTVTFGSSKAGLSTVAWSLTGGSTFFTTGVSESPANSGIYKATITFADNFAGTLSWTTGDVSPRFAAEEINPPSPTTLPAIPPAGYGNLSGISGSVIVTQDFGGVGNLSAIDAFGNGIGGATVTAFLASDYTTNGRNATPLAQVATTASGQWQTGMLLTASQSYVIFFSDRGFLPNPVTIAVP